MSDSFDDLFECPTCGRLMGIEAQCDGSVVICDEFDTLDVREMPLDEAGARVLCCSYCLGTAKVLRACGIGDPLNQKALTDVLSLVYLAGSGLESERLQDLDEEYTDTLLFRLWRLWGAYMRRSPEAVVEFEQADHPSAAVRN